MFNTSRSQDVPNCLNDKQYNTKEIVDLLEPMFHGKCYLCEQDALSNPEIEHFDPHKGDTSKKYDWDNLYYSCGRCNSIKSTKHIDLLDCCDKNINVFSEIKCLLPSVPDGSVMVTATSGSHLVQSNNTVILLERCYNETNTPLRGVTRAVLMENLFDHYTDYLGYRRTLKDKRSSDEERFLAEGRLKSMLRVSFPFSVFWRWHVLSDSFLTKVLKDHLGFNK